MAIDLDRKTEMTKAYKNDGFVIFRGALSKVALIEFQNEVSKCLSFFCADSSSTLSQRIIELNQTDKVALHRAHVAVNHLVSLSGFDKIFATMISDITIDGSPVYSIAKAILLGLPDDERLVYDFHQESNYMFGFSNIFNFHFPFLCDATVENGTMSVLKSSHRLGNLEFRESKFSENSYTDRVPIEINEIQKDFEEIDCVLELGDVLVFDQHLIHKSNRNRSSECRLVGISRLTYDANGKFI
jgi:hypothetical protein